MIDTGEPKKALAKELFGIESKLNVTCFPNKTSNVPAIDSEYVFNKEITESIIAGFNNNLRVMLRGMHGSGKSSHIEQVAARLNWPCIRVNLDGHITRLELIGKDVIKLQDGKQITEFSDGILPYAIKNGVALIFDEFDAGRPDVMFVLQRILEAEGKLTLLDQNIVLDPHPNFRIFATANTAGLGDSLGIYHGTHALNLGQIDRFQIVAKLEYPPFEVETKIIASKFKQLPIDIINKMVSFAGLTREGFRCSDLSSLMSPRTVISWALNYQIFEDIKLSLKFAFINKCDETEYKLISEYYQRVFAEEL